MSARWTAWLIGLVIMAALVGSLGRAVAWNGLGLPLILLGMALCALFAEVSALRSLARNRNSVSTPKEARPADGIVEIIAMAGVEAEVNSASPRFRKFLRLGADLRESSPIHSLTSGRPILHGQIVLISVFVGRDGSAWTEEEIARGLAALERAGIWIEHEASRYSATVNIGLSDAYFQVRDDEDDEVEVAFAAEGDDVGPMEARASTKAIVAASRAAASLGFSDVVDLFGRIEPRLDADARAWLFHLKRSGRSLAIPAEECEINGVGLAICYAREASFPEPLIGPGRVDPTTAVHELLHLFGASDKYGVPIRSFPKGLVGPRDIMRLGHDQLSRLTIDGMTASEIGWGIAGSTKNARR